MSIYICKTDQIPLNLFPKWSNVDLPIPFQLSSIRVELIASMLSQQHVLKF